jgi:tetratricopeptide (TPR) repeat protein
MPLDRALTGDDAKVVKEWENKIKELCQAGKYAEAQGGARMVLEIHRRIHGEGHWKSRQAEATLRKLEQIAALPAEARAQLADADRLDAEAETFRQQGRYAKGAELLRRVLAIRRRHLGEEHIDVVTAINDLALFLHGSGKYAEAVPLSRQALTLFRKILGEDHPDTATGYNNVASNLHARGNFPEAEPFFRQALAMRRKHLGEDHPETARSYSNLAANLNAQGKYVEAEPLCRHALIIRRKLLGEDHLDTANSYDNVASNLVAQGKLPEAEQFFRQSLTIRRKVLGEENPFTARGYTGVAAILNAQGKYAEAERLYRQALAINRKILGKEHPETADAYSRLAANLDNQGNCVDAEPLHRQAVTIRHNLLGDEHPLTARSYRNLASNLDIQGKYSEGESLSRKALTISRKVLGEVHPETADCYNKLAASCNAQGKFAEAEPFFRQALIIRRKVFAENHPDTADSYNALGSNLQEQGKVAEAEPLHRQALAIRRKVYGEDHPGTANSYNNVAMNLNAQGKFAEAAALHGQALTLCRRLLGENHPHTVLCCNNVAYNLDAQGKYAQAEPVYRHTLAVRLNVLGENHPDTAVSYSNLASNLNAQGKYAEAKPLCEQALAIRRKVYGEDHPAMANSYNNLAYCFAGQGKFAEAEPLHRQALALCHKLLGDGHSHTVLCCINTALDLNAEGKYAEAEILWTRAARNFEIARWRSSRSGLERATARVPSPFPFLAACRARLDQPLAAWRALEAALARGLLDDFSAINKQALSPEERKRFEALNAILVHLDQQIATLLTTKIHDGTAMARYRELAAQRRTTTAELDRFASDRATRELYELERIQPVLPPDTALLAWVDLKGSPRGVQGGGEHWACVVRRTGPPIWVRLAGSGSREEWTEEDDEMPVQLRLAVAQPPNHRGQDWQEIARQVAVQRLARLEPHLQGIRHLVVLADWALPLETLSERYRVSYAPSATLFARLQEQRQRIRLGERNSRILALGDPLFSFSSALPSRAKPEVSPPTQGVLLTRVLAGRNAAQSGLKPDDVLLAYAGTKVHSSAELHTAIEAQQRTYATGKAPAEAAVPVQVWRDGKVVDRIVQPGPLGARFAQLPPAEVILAKRSGDQAVQISRGSPFTPLPGTRIETETIARLFAEPVLLLGSEASAQNLGQLVAQDRMRQFRYVHLATHGVTNHRIALYSALVLAPDQVPYPGQQSAAAGPLPYGWLTAEQILHTWKLDADLVVLSACQSALGKQAGGEGYLGFAQALFLAGARSLVLSHWKVDDTATALLMVRFYQNFLGKREGLKRPMPKAEALQEAKHWLRDLTATEVKELRQQLKARVIGPTGPRPNDDTKEERPYAHPYYWSAFILIGDPG